MEKKLSICIPTFNRDHFYNNYLFLLKMNLILYLVN